MVLCDYCNQPALLVKGDRIYPHREDLYKRNYYLCEPCGAYVGCHKGTTNPLGRLANAELRLAKRNAHNAFDSLWRQGHMKRREAYKWLAYQLGLPLESCHIGMFTLEQCQMVIDIIGVVPHG